MILHLQIEYGIQRRDFAKAAHYDCFSILMTIPGILLYLYGWNDPVVRGMRVMEEEIKLGVSACLLGEQVRYDGGHKLDLYLRDTLGKFVQWVPVCPEVECGLPVPREAMRLVGDPAAPRLVTIKRGVDHTDLMMSWTRKKLAELEKEGLCGFVFKSRSPSSGMQRVKVYSASGVPANTGVGVFARMFMERFPLVPCEDEGRLQDPDIRENFIERVFVFSRWLALKREGGSAKGLVEFHSDHKLLIMSHSVTHLRELGALVANSKGFRRDALFNEYFRILTDGLKLMATVKKHTNVLQHMAGYFKKELSSDEKTELAEIIGQYHAKLIPLVVPVTLIRHYARKYAEPYLVRQLYLNPHPAELMLRNHV
jgi:uncharacterized protein YbgA (DUF1722 family)/uncharacterized protein YbbK (DUF523 family)